MLFAYVLPLNFKPKIGRNDSQRHKKCPIRHRNSSLVSRIVEKRHCEGFDYFWANLHCQRVQSTREPGLAPCPVEF